MKDNYVFLVHEEHVRRRRLKGNGVSAYAHDNTGNFRINPKCGTFISSVCFTDCSRANLEKPRSGSGNVGGVSIDMRDA